MREPSLDAVLKRAKELWKEVGYTDGAEARSVSCRGAFAPRSCATDADASPRVHPTSPQRASEKRDRLCLEAGAERSAPLMWSERPSRSLRIATNEEKASWITSGALPPSWARGAGGRVPKI